MGSTALTLASFDAKVGSELFFLLLLFTRLCDFVDNYFSADGNEMIQLSIFSIRVIVIIFMIL